MRALLVATLSGPHPPAPCCKPRSLLPLHAQLRWRLWGLPAHGSCCQVAVLCLVQARSGAESGPGTPELLQRQACMVQQLPSQG